MTILLFIHRFLIQFLLLVIVVGLITGYCFPGLGSLLQPLYPICLFVMLYPMMVGIRIGEVTGAARRFGFIAIAMALNYILSPLVVAGLANIFFKF
jgi:arsenite transporter